MHERTSYRVIRELPAPDLPGYTHPEWDKDFPWLIQGVTRAHAFGAPFDLGLFAPASIAGTVLSNWERVRQATGCRCCLLARQVHGTEVRFHREGPRGLFVAEDCDGHVTLETGILLAITVADCVPVTILHPRRRTVAVVHAGWRGIAAGIVERAIHVLEVSAGAGTAGLYVHLGPAICGACYEVGPAVFESLARPAPCGASTLDLRTVVGDRAVAAGVRAERITRSDLCTKCGAADLFSHRGGCGERQIAYVAVRP